MYRLSLACLVLSLAALSCTRTVHVTPSQQAPAPSTEAPRQSEAEQEATVYVPEHVRTMWVFLQGSVKEADCEAYARVDRQEFLDRFEEFRVAAKARGKKLIVTALSRNEGQWVDNEIKVNGKRLKPMAEYTCNGKIDYGSEVPLESK